MESNLISKSREEHFCIATGVVVAFEKRSYHQEVQLPAIAGTVFA
jgi:hypothetical protein